MQDTTADKLDPHQIIRAAGQVEAILGLAANPKVNRHKKKGDETMFLFPKDLPETTQLFETGNWTNSSPTC